MTTKDYTIDAANQRDALKEAVRWARDIGHDPVSASVIEVEPLFSFDTLAVRCIVRISDEPREMTELEKRYAWGDR